MFGLFCLTAPQYYLLRISQGHRKQSADGQAPGGEVVNNSRA